MNATLMPSRLSDAGRLSAAARRERARFAGALFLCGAVLGLVALVALPGWPVNRPAVTVTLCVAAAAGLAQLAVPAAISTPLIHLAVVGGTVLIAAVEAFTGGGEAAVAIGLLFVWVSVFTGFYFRPALVVGYLALIAAAQALVVAATGASAPLSQVILTVGTCAAAAFVVAVLARRLRRRAAIDQLTGLANRAHALSRIEAGLARGRRQGTPCALLFVDLDYFKAVNDTYGHNAGDTVLAAVARRMVETVRDGDLVARLGGDEFVVFLEDAPDPAGVLEVADRVVAAVAQPIRIGGSLAEIGASVGVVTTSDPDQDADALLRDGDTAAYEAKRSGRGHYTVFDDALRRELRHRAEIDRAVAAGLTRGQFELYYQPKIDLATGALHSVEALIRWNRPGHGTVPPDEFIPIVESSQLINDLGRWVLAEATRQLAEWDREPALRGLRTAVNISGRHLTNEQMPKDVRTALHSSGIDPARLVIEITETVLVDNPVALANIDALHEIGVQISVDDFGTGFTSIGQLLTMPIDELKIDRSFVTTPDPARWPLVKLMAHAAHTLGARVVAEGIETDQVAKGLAAAGIEYGQGYHYAHPMPAAAATDWLHHPPSPSRQAETSCTAARSPTK